MTIQSTHSNTLPKNPYLSPPSHIKEVPDLIREIAGFLSGNKSLTSFAQTSKTHYKTIIPIINLHELKTFIQKLNSYIENKKIQSPIRDLYDIQSDLNNILEKLTEAEKTLESTYPLNLSIYATKSPISNEESLTSEVINSLSYLYPEDIEKLKKNIRAPSFAKRFFPILKICTRINIPENDYARFPLDLPMSLEDSFYEKCVRDFLHEKDLHRALKTIHKRNDKVSQILFEEFPKTKYIEQFLKNSEVSLLKKIYRLCKKKGLFQDKI